MHTMTASEQAEIYILCFRDNRPKCLDVNDAEPVTSHKHVSSENTKTGPL